MAARVGNQIVARMQKVAAVCVGNMGSGCQIKVENCRVGSDVAVSDRQESAVDQKQIKSAGPEGLEVRVGTAAYSHVTHIILEMGKECVRLPIQGRVELEIRGNCSDVQLGDHAQMIVKGNCDTVTMGAGGNINVEQNCSYAQTTTSEVIVWGDCNEVHTASGAITLKGRYLGQNCESCCCGGNNTSVTTSHQVGDIIGVLVDKPCQKVVANNLTVGYRVTK
jgi:hypothetical protein